MSVSRLPDDLRQAVMADLRPVRPLARPGHRALIVAAFAPAAAVAVLAFLGMRKDTVHLGLLLTWAPFVVQSVIGACLAGTALAEVIPGGAIRRGRALGLLAAGVLALLAQSWMTVQARAATQITAPALFTGPACMTIEFLVGLCAFVLTLTLFRGSATLRVVWACVFSGAGAGLIAEGIFRLHCGIATAAHIFIWHCGAVLVLALAAYAGGRVWESLESRKMLQRVSRRPAGS